MNFIPMDLKCSRNSPNFIVGQQTGAILKDRRLYLGLTQQDVANRARIQLRQYQRLENDERGLTSASLRIALSVCAALKFDPFDFFPEIVHYAELWEKADLERSSQTLPSPHRYRLTVSENNLMLILVFTLNNCPAHYSRDLISNLLSEDGTSLSSQAENLFSEIRRSFTTHINLERRTLEDEPSPIYDPDEPVNPSTPALNVLYRFIPSNTFDEISGKRPNIGNIRDIKISEIIASPTAELLQFLRDAANFYEQHKEE